MRIYYGICTAIFGLIFGSFLNCTAMRIVRGEDFVKGRSHCMSCGHELGAADLIPLFSYLFNRGRCRHCGAKVSARYPITELTFMLLSLGLYIGVVVYGCGMGADIALDSNSAFNTELVYGSGITAAKLIVFIKYWFLTGCLFVASLTDLESFEIPDGALLTGLISFSVFTVVEFLMGIHDIKWVLHHIASGFIIGAVMLSLSLAMDKFLKRDSLGGGDIKLYALLGLYLGYAGAYELVILSCIFGLLFAAIRKKMAPEASKEFPFGPSIAAAGYVLLLFGDIITNWYLSTFL